MRNRRTLQVSMLATALVIGLIPAAFNGLSLLAILLAASALLLQPGALLRLRRPVLEIAE